MNKSVALPALLLSTFAAGVAVGHRARAVPPAPARAPAVASAVAPAPVPSQVFELRTYTTAPGRLPALEQRFRAHTRALFARHGMTNIGYWTPQDSALASNTLVYLLAYPSRAAARESWAAFGRDPEWRRVQAASEADGRIVARVASLFLEPTDYSPLR